MATPTAPPASGKRENVLTRKIGPLQTWIWVVIILVPIVVFSLIEKKKNAGSAATTAGTAGDQTDASQVPQFVNQYYTNSSPPAAPGSLPATPSTTGTATVPPSVPPVVMPPVPAGGGSGGSTGPIQSKTGGSVRTISAPGNEQLITIAKKNGLSYNQLKALNPGLFKKYEGSRKQIPKGTKVIV